MKEELNEMGKMSAWTNKWSETVEKRWSAETGKLNDHIFSKGRQLEYILSIHRSRLELLESKLELLESKLEQLLESSLDKLEGKK